MTPHGTEHKLKTLARIARALDAEGAVWAVGAGALLHLCGVTDAFTDIDITVREEDAKTAEAVLSAMGVLLPPREKSPQYLTRYFGEFTVDGVDVDVMAGLVIVSDGVAYDCPFAAAQIAGFADVCGQRVPLQSLADWKRYYTLMGRTAKAALLDR